MTLLKGNCLDTLKTLPDCSVDSIVTDPPYELGFMGKSWDNSGIAYSTELWAECLRVLKPGGHLLAFSGSRTYHRMVVAIEDSGFEIRDQIMWLYGSGFPKSLNVAKSIESKITTGSAAKNGFHKLEGERTGDGRIGMYDTVEEQGFRKVNPDQLGGFTLDATTPEAQQWQGWGTALKPAHEPIVVARKPLIGTVANNVLTYGTGALNIDKSRVGTTVETWPATRTYSSKEMSRPGSTLADDAETQSTGEAPAGRWPANVIHDGSDEVLAGFPTAKGGTWNTTAGARHFNNDGEPTLYQTSKTDNSSGSAARFFYCAKASKSERNAGLEGLPQQTGGKATGRVDGSAGLSSPRAGAGRTGGSANIHPTVKPLALMRYLVRLVTPPNGIVLDPFLGSGTTACAAILEGFEWIGCEMTEDYWPIIEARVEWAHGEFDKIVVQPELTNG